jgi:uncharacterized protein
MTENKKRVVIIHGSYGNPGENWFPWLSEEIVKLGHAALVPEFPTPDAQSLDTWKSAFKEQVGELTRDMILVGHSLGPGFILSLLEDSTSSITGTFLVSGFLGELGNDDFDSINKTFVCREFDWDRIKQNAGEVYLYNSDNDPYVPLSKGEELSKKFGVPLTIIKNGGHINASAGFQSFPKLLEDIKALLSKWR